MENNDVGIQCKGPQTITDLSKLKYIWSNLDLGSIDHLPQLIKSSTGQILDSINNDLSDSK